MTQPTFQQWLSRKPAGPKPKKHIRRTSKKRQRQGRAYSLLRDAFMVAYPKCQAWARILTAHPEAKLPIACPDSTDVHHVKGRLGGNYLNTDTWLSVARCCHDWLHAHPKESRQLGLLQ